MTDKLLVSDTAIVPGSGDSATTSKNYDFIAGAKEMAFGKY